MSRALSERPPWRSSRVRRRIRAARRRNATEGAPCRNGGGIMKRLAVCLLLSLGPGLAPCRADVDPEPPRSGQAALKKLQGTWDVVKAVKDGMDDTKELKDKGAHVVIDKDQ